jgi:rRNA maturation RNase YbeY
MNVSFNFLSTIALGSRNKLKSFIADLITEEGKTLNNLNFIFCSDEYLLNINNTYLGHNFYTDIITFDLREKGSKNISGDIFISTDRVRDNAQVFNSKLNIELHRVIFHGVLHLCGYKDKLKKAKLEMTAKEDYYLSKYFK